MITTTADYTEARPEALLQGPDADDVGCFHCGTPVRGAVFRSGDKAFCCGGCQAVFELLTENGLGDFYRFGNAAGVRAKSAPKVEEFGYLDEPELRERLVDFADERVTRATFRVPSMHCIACVWLLENLFRLNPGIGYCRVNFPRKEVSITFETRKVKLSEVVALLASLGYAPQFDFSDSEGRRRTPASRRLWLQLGVAGFAFGNIMLLSISSYLGLDAFSGPGLRKLFGWISLALALPAVVYSASGYWQAAWLALRKRIVTIDVPIAVGIAALAAWSTGEVLTGRGPGYFDSLTGLLFFLRCGKLFQQKTFDRLAFDRDYKSFFPLSILRRKEGKEERISLSQLRAGDRLVVRNGELIPSDARLISGPAMMDYSFVTGESEPVEKIAGDHLYAGGRQIGGAIEVETVKEVSQSYLTSLWNQDLLFKEKKPSLETLTNRYSRSFTIIVLTVAAGAALFWSLYDSTRALPSFVSVLIVACPCALALAVPFTLGTAQRILARRKVFLKNASVIEALARTDTVVFDKTGTLTSSGAGSIVFWGKPLREEEEGCIFSLAQHSTHPHAVRVAKSIEGKHPAQPVQSFSETAGCGIQGIVAGRDVCLGSAAWLKSRNVAVQSPATAIGSIVHIAINGSYRGCYTLASALRPGADEAIRKLSEDYELALLSGDNEKERERFVGLFGESGHLHFNQSPMNKLNFIRQLQAPGRTVLMAGDGLNDAGALKQSDVGVAVVESIGAFSPASDVIMSADMVPHLHEVLRFAKASVRVVQLSFVISAIYNLIGISIAARGLMSPVICAILMPLSSVTVVVFACGLTTRLGGRIHCAAMPEGGAGP
ncbi:MAG: heavy metal translocating P-type ATPase [Limisphaerales bacterium]